MSKHPSRRAVIVQLAAVGMITACGDKSNPPDPGYDDTGESGEEEEGEGTGGEDDTGSGGGEEEGGDEGGDEGGTDDTGTTGTDDTGDVEESNPCDVDAYEGDLERTGESGEGPNYREGQPERSNLNARGEEGYKLWIRGIIMDRNGNPLADTRIDAWQVDQEGDYNLTADDFHGHGYQRTDANGAYCFETLRPPVIYDDTTGEARNYAHVHFKIWVGSEVIGTYQLSFADDPTRTEVDVPATPDTTREVEEIGENEGVVRLDFVLPIPAEGGGEGGGGEGGGDGGGGDGEADGGSGA